MIRDFLNYNTFCPLCNSRLKLSLSTAKARFVEIEGDNLKIKFELNNFPFKRGVDKSKAILYINIDSGKIVVDSFDNNDKMYETSIPVYRVENLYKMINRNHQLHKGCPDCGKYGYSSGFIQIQLQDSGSFFPFNECVRSERMTLIKEVDSNIFSYEISNWFSTNASTVYFGRITKKELEELNSSGTISGLQYNPLALPGTMNLPILDLNSPEALVNKLEMLVVFH
jgi:hypothetical protein